MRFDLMAYFRCRTNWIVAVYLWCIYIFISSQSRRICMKMNVWDEIDNCASMRLKYKIRFYLFCFNLFFPAWIASQLNLVVDFHLTHLQFSCANQYGWKDVLIKEKWKEYDDGFDANLKRATRIARALKRTNDLHSLIKTWNKISWLSLQVSLFPLKSPAHSCDSMMPRSYIGFG